MRVASVVDEEQGLLQPYVEPIKTEPVNTVEPIATQAPMTTQTTETSGGLTLGGESGDGTAQNIGWANMTDVQRLAHSIKHGTAYQDQFANDPAALAAAQEYLAMDSQPGLLNSGDSIAQLTADGNTQAQQQEQAASNPMGFSDAQQASYDSMVQSGLVDANGNLNTEGMTKQQLYDLYTGGFGLGDTEAHQQLQQQAYEAFAAMPSPEGQISIPDSGGGLTLGGESVTTAGGSTGGSTDGNTGGSTGGDRTNTSGDQAADPNTEIRFNEETGQYEVVEVGPGGNTPEEWLEARDFIISQVESGNATPEQQQWYDDWVAAGRPETQQEMNDWRDQQNNEGNNGGSSGGSNGGSNGGGTTTEEPPDFTVTAPDDTDDGVFQPAGAGNSPEEWATNKDFIVSQVESGNASPDQQAWYDRWVQAGRPSTQAAMNEWVRQNDAGVNSSAGSAVNMAQTGDAAQASTTTADTSQATAGTANTSQANTSQATAGTANTTTANTSQASTTSANTSQATTSTYDATGYTAEEYEAAAYDAERLGDPEQAEAELAEAITRDIDDNELSQVQLERMLASDSPLMQRAAARGLQAAASRGLLNSTMAVTASQAAMIDAATPFAQQDAATYSNQALENQRAQNRANLQNSQTQTNVNVFNAEQANQNQRLNQQAANNAAQFNTAAENRASEFNAASNNEASAFNAAAENESDRFNAAAENQTSQFNASEANQQDRFNASEANQTDRFNTSESNAQDRFNASESNQQDRFNTAEANQTDRFNTSEANQQDRFNTSESNQQDRFNTSEANQTDRFNTAEANAQDRFNASEENQTDRFNTAESNQQDRFNTEQENRGLLQDDQQEFANEQANADRDQQMAYLGAQQTFAAAQAQLDREMDAASQSANLAFQAWSQTNQQEWQAAQAELDREFRESGIDQSTATAIAIQTQQSIGAIYADPNLTPAQKAQAVANVMNQSLTIPELIQNIENAVGDDDDETDNTESGNNNNNNNTDDPFNGNGTFDETTGRWGYTNDEGMLIEYDPATNQYYVNGSPLNLNIGPFG